MKMPAAVVTMAQMPPVRVGLGSCYTWEKSCALPVDPCKTRTVAAKSCADTQTWFWALAAVGVGALVLRSLKK